MVAIKVTDPLDVQIHIASKKGYLSNKDIHRGSGMQSDGVVHDLAYLFRLCQANLGWSHPIYYAEQLRDFDQVYGAGKWQKCKYCHK